MSDKNRKINRYQVKAVIFDVQAEYRQLKQKLTDAGIRVLVPFLGLQAEAALQNVLATTSLKFQECLLITNNEQHVQCAQSLGMAVAGCLEGHFEVPKRVPLLENLEEISINYLNQLYCHAKKLPATIAETSRCFLCEITEAQTEALYEIVTEEETAKYLEAKEGSKKEELQKLCAYVTYVYSFFEYAYWGIFSKETGELIGRAGFKEGIYPLEAGYVIKRSEWGKGLATEVLKELVRYAKEELDCTEVYAVIEENNKASLRVAEKCGLICNRLRC